MAHDYRIYRFDRAKHVVEVDWLSADSDADAIAAARVVYNASRREVWLGDRLVATIPAGAAEEPSAAYWL